MLVSFFCYFVCLICALSLLCFFLFWFCAFAFLQWFGTSDLQRFFMDVLLQIDRVHFIDMILEYQDNKSNKESIHFLVVDVVNFFFFLFYCRTQPQYQFERFLIRTWCLCGLTTPNRARTNLFLFHGFHSKCKQVVKLSI